MSFPLPVSNRAETEPHFDVLTARRIAVCIRRFQSRSQADECDYKGEGGQLGNFYKTLKDGDSFDITVKNFKGA